jgi:hypothetical protein
VLRIRLTLMRIRILLFTLMRNRILDVDPDSTFYFDPDLAPTTHFFPDLDPLMLQNYLLGLQPFHFDTDPDSGPYFHFDADPEPAFHFYVDPDPQHCFKGTADDLFVYLLGPLFRRNKRLLRLCWILYTITIKLHRVFHKMLIELGTFSKIFCMSAYFCKRRF